MEKKIISAVSTYLFKQWFNSLKDNTAYKDETKEVIDIAVEMYNDGDYIKSLKMLLSLAKQIDCKNFHRYGLLGAYRIRNRDAREQYNRICLYIARIYDIRKEYSQVQFWANNLAFIRDISVSEWESLLNPTDFEELRDFFGSCNSDTDAASEAWNDYLSSPWGN